MHHCQDLITVFHDCFFKEYNTVLIGGAHEPLYLPKNEHTSHHSLFFTRDFFSSALHECSHWFIAGKHRRTQIDFGYWYVPDGRTSGEQTLFQNAEVKPQALEWILSMAAGHPFQTSVDNLNGQESDTYAFRIAVHKQIQNYCEHDLPKRARAFRQALCDFYKTPLTLQCQDFKVEALL
jgi:elongation factor P hydroxylase